MRVDVLLLWVCVVVLIATGCRSSADQKAQGAPQASTSGTNQPDLELPDPDRPPPPLPVEAFFLAPYSDLKLGITAAKDGSVQSVVVSKPSKAGVYDEYIRKWVEKKWKMPPARPGEPDARKFIAPIVFQRAPVFPEGSFPAPPYPAGMMRLHIEGMILLDVKVASSGKIMSVKVNRSSGHKALDDYVVDWVETRWRFRPAEPQWYLVPFLFLLD